MKTFRSHFWEHVIWIVSFLVATLMATEALG
jgi:hypothetical protein